MEFVTKERFPASERTKALFRAEGKKAEGCTLSWDILGDDDLTMDEMKALRRKHKTRGVNYARAAEVKRLMLQGKRCMEIVYALHRKYRQTMVKRDHAALLPYCDRGGAKRRR